LISINRTKTYTCSQLLKLAKACFHFKSFIHFFPTKIGSKKSRDLLIVCMCRFGTRSYGRRARILKAPRDCADLLTSPRPANSNREAEILCTRSSEKPALFAGTSCSFGHTIPKSQQLIFRCSNRPFQRQLVPSLH
jgi:hypothetical protein